MAVIIADATNLAYDGNLSTANGFYRTIGSNWSALYASASSIALSTPRAQDITFSAAGNLKGIVTMINSNQSSYSTVTHCDRSVIMSLQEIKGACTMDITTERVTYATHGLSDGDMVSFSTTGTLPTGVTANRVYYVVNKDTNTFQISLTLGGDAVLMSGANGTGHVLWVVMRSKTLTATEIYNTTDNTCAQGLVPFEFSSTYAVDTTASKWRFCMEQIGGTANYWYGQLSAASQPWVYAVWDDTQVSFTSEDSLIVKDPVTIDQDATFKGVLGAGVTGNNWAIALCRNTDPTVANVGNLLVDSSASRTITINGQLAYSTHSGPQFGTSASRISYTNQLIIDFIAPTAGTLCGIISTKGYASDYATRGSFQFYGERPTLPDTTLAADVGGGSGTATISIASPCVVTKTALGVVNGDPLSFTTSGALPTGLTADTLYFARTINATTCHLYDTYAHAIDTGSTTGRIDTSGTQSGTHTLQYGILTTDDCSSVWQVGDYVSVGGPTTIGATGFFSTRRAIVAISGNAIALSIGVASASKAGHPVINLTNGYGIVIRGNDTAVASGFVSGAANFVLDGVQVRSFYGFITGYTSTPAWSHEDATARSKWYTTYCSCWALTASSTRSLVYTIVVPPEGFEISHNIASNYGVVINNGQHQYLVSGAGKSGTLLIDNNIQVGAPTSQGFTATTSAVMKFTLSNNIFELGGTGTGIYLQGLGCTITNNRFWNINSAIMGGLNFWNLFNSTGSGNYFDLCGVGIAFQNGNTINNVFTNNIFGSEVANTKDFFMVDGVLFGHKEVSLTGAVTVDTTYITGCPSGSELKIDGYNDTVGDVRSWIPEGTIVSDTDALIAESWNGDATLSNQYKMGSLAISGAQAAIIVTCDIQNAAYYAGTHTLPKVTVQFDNGAGEEDDSASASTDEQTIIVPFTPSTDYNDVFITLAQKTDATGTDADVRWSDLTVIKRTYGNIYTSFTKAITQTVVEPIYTIQTGSANPFITETTEATVAAYSEFTIDHGAQSITITADTTLARLYDYSQYDLAQSANYGYSEWYTTIDGVNFTSDYDIILNTGVDLTGGGTIDVGANAFTKTGTATYDGIIITSTDRKVHINLNTLVAGSTVYIYNTSDSAEIYKDVVAGTSLDYIFDYTANKDILIKVRKAGYLSYETTGTIASTGFSLNVGQQVDSIYVANGIDGSTVTECSLQEGVVGIFIDDPTNATTGQRIYNWYAYTTSTTAYIDDQASLITAQTAWSYVLDDTLLLKNEDLSNPLYIEGANINNESSTGQVIDTTGGSININGYFPFNSVADVKTAVGALTLGQFIALR